MDRLVIKARPIKHHIFRKYDIRGIAGSEVTAELAYQIGRGFATCIKQTASGRVSLAVGKDNRPSSPELHAAVCEGLADTGCDVLDVGLVPSPVVNFAVASWQLDGGIIVTASHNPPNQNGFKLMAKGAYPVAEDDIQHLLALIEEHSFLHGKGSIAFRDVREEYLDKVSSLVNVKRPLRVVIDSGNGVAGSFAPELLRRTGCEVTELYCESDGTFPHHMPNPENAANMRDLQEKVIASGADIGFAYDGDGDRLGVVSEKGIRYDSDHIIILLSRDFLSRHPGARVLMDVKSSQLVMEDILLHGGVPIIWKTGHSLIKRKMHEDRILLAGEFSGHMFPAEDYYPIDDAMLASCRLAEYLSHQNLPLSELLGKIPEMFSTAAIELACPDEEKFKVVNELVRFFSKKYELLDVDGARIMFNGGWALVRASNTSANLTLRFEADSGERLAEIQSIVYGKMREFPAVKLSSLVS